MTTQRFWPHATKTLFTLTLALVALADWLFYEHTLGWTLGLYLIVLAATTCIRLRRSRFDKHAWALVILATGSGLSLIYNPGTIAVALGLLAISMLSITNRVGWSKEVSTWIQRLCWLFVSAWPRFSPISSC